jgi:hypothetical protein
MSANRRRAIPGRVSGPEVREPRGMREEMAFPMPEEAAT